MSAPLSFEEIALVVRLHDELTAADRLDEAETLRGLLTRAQSPARQETDDERRRRLARDRKRRSRDSHAMSRLDRDMSRNVTRDQSVTERDMINDGPGGVIAKAVEFPHVSPSTSDGAARDMQRDQSVTLRDMGGKGGVVVSNSTNREEKTTKTNARERDMSRNVTRDNGVTLTPMLPLAQTTRRLAVLSEHSRKRDRTLRMQVELVFAYWCAALAKRRAILSTGREQSIAARLRENGGDASELCYAIDGIKQSKYHMGANDSKMRYDDITVVCKDRSQVERFAGTQAGFQREEEHPFVRDARNELLAQSAVASIAQQEVMHA